MFNNKDKKYKLIRGEKQNPRGKTGDYYTRRVYRLVALRDIPEYGVKAGDLGGLVTSKNMLSHKGSCWIGEEAEAFGNVSIGDDAYLGGNASVRTGSNTHMVYLLNNTRVEGNAIIEMANYSDGFTTIGHLYIMNEAHIYDDAILKNVRDVSGKAKIYGNACLKGVKEVTDTAEIFEDSFIDKDVIILGNSKIYGKARIEEKSTIRNSDVSGEVIVPKYETIGERTLNSMHQIDPRIANPALESSSTPKTTAVSSKKSRLLSIYGEIIDKIATYETDIVKIIKYPSMTDRSNASTLAMALAKTTAERLVADVECEEAELSEAVKDLEAKFMVAESQALKMAATTLSETERRKVEKAKDLLALASNEASTEQEKKVSFKQAFKQLEGVLVVPEVAVDTFRIKVGLKEIEA